MSDLSPAKELARERIHGLWMATTTPFRADGTIDDDALAAQTEHLISGLGVDGIYCGGMMGEFWSLSMAERRHVHERVADVTAGRIPLMAHTGHESIRETIDLTLHSKEIGIEFAIAINPFFPPKLGDEEILRWFTAIDAEAGSQPMFLFNTMFSGYSLSVDLIDRLADIDSICGIKTPRPKDQFLEILGRVGERIVVTDAGEEEWLEYHLDHGVQALMSTPALAMFQTASRRPIVEYTELAKSGDLDAAWQLHATLAEHRRIFHKYLRTPWLERGVTPIAHLKAWFELMGWPQGPVRAPLVELTEAERGEIRTDLESLGLI